RALHPAGARRGAGRAAHRSRRRALIALARLLLAGAMLWLCACAPAQGQGAPAPPARQILVMLRLPPDHFRPSASYGGGYGDAAGAAARQRIASRLARLHGLSVVKGWPMPVLGVDCY